MTFESGYLDMNIALHRGQEGLGSAVRCDRIVADTAASEHRIALDHGESGLRQRGQSALLARRRQQRGPRRTAPDD